MATRVTLPQVNFTGGEVTPLVDARADVDWYNNSCRILVNFILRPQGSVMLRAGTRVICAIKDSAAKGDLIPFDFSPEQAYQIEVGDLMFRFYKDRGRIEVTGTPVEIATPYAEETLFDAEGKLKIRYAQSLDVVYLVHPSFRPQKLERSSHVDWTIAPVDFIDGPYLDENTTATTLAAGAVTGTSIAIVASADVFKATDVDRLVRIGHPATKWAASTGYSVGDIRFNQGNVYIVAKGGAGTSSSSGGPTGTGLGIPDGTAIWDFVNTGGLRWGWSVVTVVTDARNITVEVKGDFASTSASASWQLGLWNNLDGWPAVVKFFEERVIYGGPGARPTRVDGSKVGAFETFTPGINDDDAIAYNIATDEQNTVRWIAPMHDLVLGTLGAEFRAAGDTDTAAITPTAISVKKQTNYGVSNLDPTLIGNAILFFQRQARKLISLVFDLGSGAYAGHDMTARAEHITRSGIVSTAWQQEPFGILWCARADGVLAAFTFLDEQAVKGWHRHVLGVPAGGKAEVECVSRIPGPEGGTGADQVWMIVKRTSVDGATVKRYVEVLDDPQPDDGDPFDAFHLDCGLTYDGRLDYGLTFTAAAGTGVVFTAASDTFVSGDVGRQIRYRAKSTDLVTEVITWSNAIATITAYTDARHVVADITGGTFPASLSAAAMSWGLTVTEIDGLDLQAAIADEVTGLADGVPIGPLAIVDNAVTLTDPAVRVHLGFGYRGMLQPMKISGGSPSGTSLGQIKRIDSIIVQFYRSLGARVGNDLTTLQDIPFRDITAPADLAPDLFSGPFEVELASDYEREGNVVVVQDAPLPCQVTALFPRVSVEEG